MGREWTCGRAFTAPTVARVATSAFVTVNMAIDFEIRNLTVRIERNMQDKTRRKTQ